MVDNRGISEYTTQSLLVNGKKVLFKRKSSFTLGLKSLGVARGDSLKIHLIHLKEKPPVVMNYENILLEEVDVEKLSVDEHGVLEFTALGEVAPLCYYVEGFRWDSWVRIDTITGVGDYQKHKYTTTVPLHEGQNEFRIARPNFSLMNSIVSDTLLIDFPHIGEPKVKTGKKSIEFSRATYYEVFDPYGIQIMTGSGTEIRLNGLESGKYYLNYDNKQSSFELGKGKIALE